MRCPVRETPGRDAQRAEAARILIVDDQPANVRLLESILRQARERALGLGASDFLPKPFDPVEVLLRIRNFLRTRRLHQALLRQTEVLEARVRERTLELIGPGGAGRRARRPARPDPPGHPHAGQRPGGARNVTSAACRTSEEFPFRTGK